MDSSLDQPRSHRTGHLKPTIYVMQDKFILVINDIMIVS